VTTFLKQSAQAQPLLLVLDDLHWADQSSLLLLEYVAREIAAAAFFWWAPIGTPSFPGITP
jgi:predicted ATPase